MGSIPIIRPFVFLFARLARQTFETLEDRQFFRLTAHNGAGLVRSPPPYRLPSSFARTRPGWRSKAGTNKQASQT